MAHNSPLPGTGISCIADRKWSGSVFYQLLDRNINRSRHLDGVWTQDQLTARPAALSPLASVTYYNGSQIRIYYLDEDHVLQEFAYSQGKGWYQGDIGRLKVKPVPIAGLAAITYEDEGFGLRVYFQERESDRISEVFWKDGAWHTTQLSLAGAIHGTSISTVAYHFQNQLQVRLYYQTPDLSLKEYAYKDKKWFQGEFNPGIAFGRTSISAIAFKEVELQVYWHDLHGRVAFSKNTGSWSHPTKIEGIGPSHGLTVLQWDDGKNIRVYYQEREAHISEFCSDDSGDTWFPGKKDLSS